MTGSKALFAFLCALISLAFTPLAFPQPDCITPDYIEELNQGVIHKRYARVQGVNARLYVALDPIMSSPNFEDLPYRHEEDNEMIKRDFERLMNQNIDEVIIWKFRRYGLGAAVAFSNGCGIEGYGEPDNYNKLTLMHDAYELVTEEGLDSSSVRDAIDQLLNASRYAGLDGREDKIDTIINTIRPLIKNSN